jgi:hypothetical protein
MAQAGIQDVLSLFPQVMIGAFSITKPVSLTLPQMRIMGDTNPTYGTAGGWTPPIDGSPWAIIMGVKTKESAPIPNEKLVKSNVDIFVAVDHSDTAALAQNYNAIALAWIDAARQFFPQNRRLYPYSQTTLDPSIWDVLCDFLGGDVVPAHPVFGTTWYGALLHIALEFKAAVSYQS